MSRTFGSQGSRYEKMDRTTLGIKTKRWTHKMDPRVTCIPTRIKELSREIDDIEWENHRDPRIEGLINELNYLKKQEEKGIIYEPNF